MDMNFSKFNLEYFIAARDFANHNMITASTHLGTSTDFMRSIANLSPKQLANISNVNVPLIIPREESTWWANFLRALKDDNRNEIKALAEQTSFYFIES